jgi:maltooligosyltrehalose trehalohydrolase
MTASENDMQVLPGVPTFAKATETLDVVASRPSAASRHRRLPVGADLQAEGVHFRVWAPDRQNVAVVLAEGIETLRAVPLAPEGNGYFSVFIEQAKAGTLYWYRVDGENELLPDPASRFQPEGPIGPSEVIDPEAFAWRDEAWVGVKSTGNVLYEMHVGAFTKEGTYRAAIEQLPELAELGITIIEIMPVADFAGRFGWGYDGVDLFAPTRLYGGPDDFRAFVTAAHCLGLGVILDVVYNHFGPVGNFVPKFAKYYCSERHKTDWGEAINFMESNAVRYASSSLPT